MSLNTENIEFFFELDINNCYLNKSDFCGIIADFINNPVKTKKLYIKNIIDYYNERIMDGAYNDGNIIELPIKNETQLKRFLKRINKKDNNKNEI